MKRLTIGLCIPYSYDYIGGVQTHTINLGVALTQLGHNVIYLSPTSRKVDCPQPHYHTGYALTINSPLGSKTNISYPISYTNLSNGVSRCDILHFQEILSPFSTWNLLSKSTKPNIITLHTGWDDKKHTFIRWYLSYIRKNFYEKYISTITVSLVSSRSNQMLLKKNSLIPPAISVAAVQQPQHKPRSFSMPGYHVVFVGRINKRKGIIELVRAIFKARQLLRSQIYLHVIGDGNLMAKLSELISKLNLNEVVILEGRRSHQEKYAFLQHANLAVFPSTHGESFGVVLIEALAAGCPIVAGNNDGYKDTLKDYPHQEYVVDASDDLALANAIASLLTNRAHQKNIKVWAKKFVAQFDSLEVAKKHLELYRNILE